MIAITGFIIYMIVKKNDFDKNKSKPDAGGKNDEDYGGNDEGGGEG